MMESPTSCTSTSTSASHVVPVIDLSAFGNHHHGLSESSAPQVQLQLANQEKVAREIQMACEQVGFFYITGHGCPAWVLDRMLEHTRHLFDLPLEEKHALEARNNPLYRGYNSIETGAHSCTPQDANHHLPDLKESFTIGAEEEEEEEESTTTTTRTSPMHGPNQWPSAALIPGFETAVRQYWHHMTHTVGTRLLRALAMSLELPVDFFTSKAQRNPHSQMVLLRYPPADQDQDDKDDKDDDMPLDSNTGRRGCGAHTDCGFVTILLQDAPGLQVQTTNGTWVSAPPLLFDDNNDSNNNNNSSSSKTHALVVNLGDMMAHWTNDRYKSTPHSVTNPSSTITRHSVPFFLAVDYDTLVETIPSCRNHNHNHNNGQEVCYEPCRSGEYILQKLGLMHLAKPKPKKAKPSHDMPAE
jgi:isopenicillin N synthase-like dioxygenase